MFWALGLQSGGPRSGLGIKRLGALGLRVVG